MNNLDFIIRASIMSLLPMIPAIIIFKIFPTRSNVDGSGEFYGMEWKFGGSFAGYIFVQLVLLFSFRSYLTPDISEIWSIHGTLEAQGLQNADYMSKNLDIRTYPEVIPKIFPDGEFQIEVLRRNDNGSMSLPRLIFDMKKECYSAKSIPLNGEGITFNEAAASTKFVKNRDETRKRIDLEPIIFKKIEGCESERKKNDN